MASSEGLYSRAIAWLKILLPLAALVLLSTLFLFARSAEPPTDLPFSDALSKDVTAGEQVGAPYFAGSTDRGDMLTMSARRASPDGDGRIRADAVSATLTLTDGSRIELHSGDALLTDARSEALLQGGVEIRSSTGYDMQTERFRASLDKVEGESLGPVRGTGPTGTLEAGKMRIVSDAETGNTQLLFTDGVKLVYVPQS